MFCPNCGMQNPETASTCQKCGFAMKTAAPKFKGTMLMMNQPGASQVPQPRPASSPAIPPTTGGVAPGSNPQPNSGPSFAAEAPPMGGTGVPSQVGVAGAVGANAPPSRLKGTIVGVAPPKAGAAPGAPQGMGGPGAGAPPAGVGAGAPGTQMMPQQFGQPGVNALGSTVAVGDNGLPPGFQIPETPGMPAGPPPAAGAPPGAEFGAPPPPGGAPGFGGPPPDFSGGQYGAPPPGGAPGGFGAPPPQDFGAPPGGGYPNQPMQQQQPGMMGVPPPGGFGMQQYPGAPMMGPGGGPMMMAPGEGKSWMLTLLLCAFGGGFGAHRFYTGHILFGVIQLLTCGGFGVWFIIDFVFILMGKYTDAQGRPLVKT